MNENFLDTEIDNLCRNHFQILRELELEKMDLSYEVIKSKVIEMIESVENADTQITIDDLNDELITYLESVDIKDWKQILLFDAITIDITTQYKICILFEKCDCCKTCNTQMIVIKKYASFEEKIRDLLCHSVREDNHQNK